MTQQQQPLVTVIVPTYNSAATLDACLHSIKMQTYKNIELIVVDNHSKDDTQMLAKRYADQLYIRGPERSAQRNYGGSKAKGEYIVFIDSDMELGPKVIAECVTAMQPGVAGVVIHEESFGSNFWARCKALERSYYVNQPWIEAARFFTIKTYRQLKGYNETLVSGEDWDLSRRAQKLGSIVAIDEFIRHNEGSINLRKTLKKKYYYAQHAAAFFKANPSESAISSESGPIARYKLFFSQPGKLLEHPLQGIGMLFMKTCEYGAGGIGYALGRK